MKDLVLLCHRWHLQTAVCSASFQSQPPETIQRGNQPNEGKMCKYFPSIGCHLLSPLLFFYLNCLCFHCFRLCQIMCYVPECLSIFLAACPLCFTITLIVYLLVKWPILTIKINSDKYVEWIENIDRIILTQKS
jgi:hypothetical protein